MKTLLLLALVCFSIPALAQQKTDSVQLTVKLVPKQHKHHTFTVSVKTDTSKYKIGGMIIAVWRHQTSPKRKNFWTITPIGGKLPPKDQQWDVFMAMITKIE